jgi:hypothetical protein
VTAKPPAREFRDDVWNGHALNQALGDKIADRFWVSTTYVPKSCRSFHHARSAALISSSISGAE